VSNFAVGATNPPGLGLDRTLIYGAGLSQTFELGKRGPRAEAADLRLRAAERRVADARSNRVADARLALGRAVYTGLRQHAFERALDAARSSTRIAKGRLEHRALSGVDYDRLVLDSSSLEAEAARSSADSAAALAECEAVLLAPCDLTGTSESDLDAADPSPRALDASALERRADVAALRLESEAAHQDATVAARRAIPDLTFRVGYTHDRFTISGDNANTLSLSVAAPLPLFDRGQHDETRALARAEEARRLAASALAAARGDLSALTARSTAIARTLATLRKDALPRARAVLQAQEQGLAEGQLDMTDLLLARRQAIDLELLDLDLRFELFSVRNEIRRVLGADEARPRK